MLLYRIVKEAVRARDLSGTGAFRYGGRWNSPGTYLLYTSENASLALLESLVHFDLLETVPDLHVLTLEVADAAPMTLLPEGDYPPRWKAPELKATKALGDRFAGEGKWLGLGVRSAVNPIERNWLLNPRFPGFADLVTIRSVQKLSVDPRLTGV